jgi:hypothetical protein
LELESKATLHPADDLARRDLICRSRDMNFREYWSKGHLGTPKYKQGYLCKSG